ncbi:uncharacterized protein LOC127868791 isoform X2 [Dreissena polymorpha]|uniref:uncharacterized protein LOC127868791 isoform X2 n=1 Tax=Dreissena polymorpha TaxID=45954 RepID=UPI00226432D7|nr:uncharacterized protein LOC127868791 isoform X2 [Dreissena polymorpha]
MGNTNHTRSRVEASKRIIYGCLDSNGRVICSPGYVCVKGMKTLCDPPDMHPKCHCERDKVVGCEDLVGNIICKDDQKCLDAKLKECFRTRSTSCGCRAPPLAITDDYDNDNDFGDSQGCKVYIDDKPVFVPYDARNWKVPKSCYMCSCLNKVGLGYESDCKKVDDCVDFLHGG